MSAVTSPVQPVWWDAAGLPLRPHRAFRDDDLVLLGHARDRDGRAADEGVVLDLSVERLLADEVKRTGHHPFHVVGETRQDERVVALPEAFHVRVDGALVLGHRLSGRRTRRR
jgi:hypothetical protein